MCLCYWPPVRLVCPNHDVVILQPRTGTAPELGSVANFYNFKYIPPASSGLTVSGLLKFPPPFYRPYISSR